MKRLMVLMLCLALCLTVVSAQAVSMAKVVGRWYFVSVDGNGLTGDSYIEFNRDKSVTLVVAGMAKDMTGFEWKVSDDRIQVIEHDGFMPEFDMAYADDVLTMKSNNLGELAGNAFFPEFKLARTAPTYNTPALADAAAEEEFFGEYSVYLMTQNGQYMEMSGDGNGYEIMEYVVVVNSEGEEPQEYLTNFKDGKLVMYGPTEMIVSRTADPDVIATYESGRPGSIIYLRRIGAQPAAAPTQLPVIPDPAPAATEKPANPSFPGMATLPTAAPKASEAPTPAATEKPANPSFPGMAALPTQAPKATGAAAFYGSYIVYQDRLANGKVLDMTARGLKAAIDEKGVHVTAYGQQLTVPYEYANGLMGADISAVYPDYGFAIASLADNGELVVSLVNAEGNVGETLYLRRQ